MRSRDSLACPEDGKQDGAESQHDPIVEQHGTRVYRNGDREAGDTEYRKNVEDVGAQQIAQRDLVLSVFGGNGRSREFWKTRSHGNHRESDDSLGNAHDLGDGCCSGDEKVGAHLQSHDTEDDVPDARRPCAAAVSGDGVDAGDLRVSPGVIDRPRGTGA